MRQLLSSLVLIAAACGATAQAAGCDAPPDTMRAVRYREAGGPEKLQLETLPLPKPEAGEVLVRVSAASVNPVDWKRRERSTPAEPTILGGDIAGTIVALGTGAGDWQCGDKVVAILDKSRQGGYAEYVPVKNEELARKPANLSFREGAAFPLVALTAWQATVDAGKVKAGERVLVHGGAGGVGSMAVQIAKQQGAYVITTASARNHDYVKSLGADEAIDYRSVPFEDVVKDIDLVVDTVGSDTLERSPKVLKRGGRLITVAGRVPAEACNAAGITCATEWLSARPGTLVTLADWFAQGKLRIHVDATYPLAEAAAAQEKNREGHTRGKIVLDVRDDAGSR